MFSCACCPWHVFFGEMSIQIFCPFLNWVVQFFGFFNKFIYFIYFMFGCIGSSLLRALRAFSSCGKLGLLFIAVCKLLIEVASLVAEHGPQVCRLQQLWCVGSVVVTHGLQSTGSVVLVHGLSCFTACGIFLDRD